MNAQKRAELKRIADSMYQSWVDLVELDDESLAGLSDDVRKQLLEAVDKLDPGEREINERIQKYAIPCEGHYVESWEGREFYCDYENAPDCCSDCICHGGSINPETGKRVYKRMKRGMQ